MPYGKNTTVRNNRAKSYAARGRNARQNKFAKARTAVAKIQRKPYVPRIVKNTQSVYQLANAVKRLQQAQLGQYQKRAEEFSWTKTSDAVHRPFGKTQPIAICLNQFTGGRDPASSTGYFRAGVIGTASTGEGYIMKRWEDYSLVAFTGREALNPHWGANDDGVSHELYQPLGTQLKFEILYNSIGAADPTNWIRFDVISPKKILPESTLHTLNMPKGIGQFANLGDQHMLQRGYINKEYWKVHSTKWVSFSNNSGVAKMMIKTVTINQSFKGTKPLNPDFDALDHSTSAGGNPTFTQNIDPRQLRWLVISVGSNASVPDQLNVLRHTSWRDQHGTTA